ncbi:MAG TPA: glycoside hydrolase family 88 protein, partial [Longimicrobiales bacterium]
VYATSPRPQYRAYVQNAAAWLDTRQGRLEDGTLVRSFPRRWTLWADDLFMAVPFLARMSQLSGDPRYLDDAAHQVASYFRYLFNDDTGLMVHNWYSDTGRPGVAYWGRANGWALLAEVELLDRLPEQHAQRDTVLALFRRHIVGVARYQGANGLWHQLLDKPDSYEETSASAMFTYAIAHAVLRGYIPDSYAPVAQRGWAGVRTRIRVDGQIEGVCSGTVVSDNLTDYYQRPTPLNDVHGVGAVLWAGAEMIALQARR